MKVLVAIGTATQKQRQKYKKQEHHTEKKKTLDYNDTRFPGTMLDKKSPSSIEK